MQYKINKSGSIQILSMFIICCLLSLSLALMLKLKENSRIIKDRASTYLCAQHYIITTKYYIKKMSFLNRKLPILFIAKKVPKTAAAAKIAISIVIATQQFYHMRFLKKILTNKYCTKAQKLLISKHMPYKSTLMGLLKRGKFSTTIVNKKKWNTYIPIKNLKENYKKGFMIDIEMKLKSQYSRRPHIYLKEKNAWDLLNLKL